jgi:Tfp pilus assembly protein PilO
MQQHRIAVLLSVLIMLIIPVLGWFLVAQPQLAAAAIADKARLDAAAQIAASQQVVAQLKQDAAKLPELESDLDELRASIPAGVDPSGYIDGLSALAKVSDVQITELGVSDPLAYVPADPPAAATPPAPADTSGDASATPSATPTPVDVPGLVTNPLVNASNFVAIPVTVEVTGSNAAILHFVHGLQSGDRLFLVTELNTEPAADAGSGRILGKVTGYIYAIPTGVEGDPRPVSTVVKSMVPKKPATPDPGSTSTPTGGPTPDPTETANP